VKWDGKNFSSRTKLGKAAFGYYRSVVIYLRRSKFEGNPTVLRRQSLPLNPMSFLNGEGEMAKRIRQHDWTGHPFGSPELWPQSLRSALSICLHSSFPTAIYWGPELRLLYNDAWAPIPGPRHPAALGAPAQDVWSDIWHVIEPQFSRLIATGEGIFVEDQMLPMRRFGATEETYWSYSFTAIRGEDGAIAGVFNSGHETTRNVLSRRQIAFMLELSEAFRSASDAKSARQIAIAMLGRHLGADRVGFREVEAGSHDPAVVEEWTAPGVTPVGKGAPISKLGEWAHTQLNAGNVLRIDDVTNQPKLADARKAFETLDIGAAMAVPWMDQGRALAIIYIHSRRARVWTDFDVSTAEQVLDRTLSWIERERSAERERTIMREIDHRARNLLAVIRSVVKLTNADDVAALREKIGDRVTALARTHDLLASERWQPIELETLIRDELAPYIDAADDRVVTTGPSFKLQPERAQTFALLLHELTTNAAKYGALSQKGGMLDVRWSDGTQGVLEIYWTEHLPGKIATPEDHKIGFGTILLRRVVEDQLHGNIRRTFKSNGLQYHLIIPQKMSGERALAAPALNIKPSGSNHVLLVEDDPLLRIDMEDMVIGMGLNVFAAVPSVGDALAVLESALPDLAILDANLGGESSIPVAELLVSRGVPTIFSTGYTRLTDLPDALASLPRLHKPIDPEALAKTISDLGLSVSYSTTKSP